MWKKNPDSVNAHAIAKQINMTHGSVMYHFPYGVKDAVAEYAVEKKDSKIVAQLIVLGHKAVQNLSPTEKSEFMGGY